MTETKYFAYYIPENRETLMNNILHTLKQEYDSQIATQMYELIDGNIKINYSNTITNETQYLNSLVLIKFTLVNDIFVKENDIMNNNNENNSNYKKISQSNEYYKIKYINRGDSSNVKSKKVFFSGTKQNNYEINEDIQYIFSEIITIPLINIMNIYPLLNFDSNGKIIFQKQLDKYITSGHLTNIAIENILKITNRILGRVKYVKDNETYRDLQVFVPLIETDGGGDSNGNNIYTNMIKDLWENYLYKQPDDPYEMMHNHHLITNNMSININIDTSSTDTITRDTSTRDTNTTDTNTTNTNTNTNNLIINCPVLSKLHITLTKSFADITYTDALPFKNYFICKDTIKTDIKHNNILEKITMLESKISNINKNNNNKQSETIKTQNAELIASLKTDIEILKTNLSKIDPQYKNHILFNTHIGFRLTFQDNLNSYTTLIYLQYICNNKDRLNKNFVFNYNKINETDIVNFYVHKDLINDLVSLKIKPDLFTISRLFKITMDEKYKDDKFKITNYEKNSSNKILINKNENDSAIINKFNTFLENNINLNLFEYQKNNVLWMLKIEDDVDSQKLKVNSFIGNFEVNFYHIEDIKIYLHNLRVRCPEVILKNYIINHNGKKCVIDIRNDATIAQYASIMSILNAENLRTNINYNNFDFNIINKILPKDDYIKEHSKPIELCGGVICDEVGLGKTLSIISHLVVKLKDDMKKYKTYKTEMTAFIEKIKRISLTRENITNIPTDILNFKDPLENAFEYNNLIIVPSRLTSQWESEIVKYVQNKFKLRAKVLVSISSIKTLEKELRDFYDKKTRQKDAKAGKASRTKSETAEKVKAEKVNTTVKLETIINNTNNNNINIIEDNDEQINITKTKSKEQKFIYKLMKQAKKNNDKLLKKHKTKTETKTETKIETETETYIQQITFDDIFNDISNDISNNNPPRIVAIPNVVPQDNRQQITTSQYDYINKYIETESESDESDQLYDIYIVSINLLSNENYLNYICHNAGNHLQPHINGNTTMECKLNKLIKTKNYHTGPSQICRLTDKFNIFKIKWNRIIFDEAHEKLIPVVKLFSTSIKKYVQGSSGVKINSESQFLFENLCVLNSNYKWAITGTPTQNGIDNIMGIIEFLTKKNYEESNFVKLEKLRFLSDIVGI